MNLKVKGEAIYRDLDTNALVFTNQDEIAAYKTKKKAIRDRDLEINSIKQELNEIKKMLIALTEKPKN
jgi:hypothetical protein